MKTLNISISDSEYVRYGIKQEQLSFPDLVEIVSKEIMRQNLIKCVEMAEKYGLSDMTIEEISEEVKIVRRDAKNRN